MRPSAKRDWMASKELTGAGMFMGWLLASRWATQIVRSQLLAKLGQAAAKTMQELHAA